MSFNTRIPHSTGKELTQNLFIDNTKETNNTQSKSTALQKKTVKSEVASKNIKDSIQNWINQTGIEKLSSKNSKQIKQNIATASTLYENIKKTNPISKKEFLNIFQSCLDRMRDSNRHLSSHWADEFFSTFKDSIYFENITKLVVKQEVPDYDNIKHDENPLDLAQVHDVDHQILANKIKTLESEVSSIMNKIDSIGTEHERLGKSISRINQKINSCKDENELEKLKVQRDEFNISYRNCVVNAGDLMINSEKIAQEIRLLKEEEAKLFSKLESKRDT